MKEILDWFNQNQGLAQWVLVVLAGGAFYVAYKEFIQKRRPYIDIEIQVAKNPDKKIGGWLFFGLLINRGTYPALSKVTHTLMRIGDEEYPSSVKENMVIFPGESKKSALIGSINEKGIGKILGREYKINRVELEIRVASKELESKNFRYETSFTYQVNVSGNIPEFIILSEEFK